MSDLNESFNLIKESVAWLAKEIEKLQKNKPLNKEQVLHANNLEKKLQWEWRQLNKSK
jgi:hypothetical protein